MSDQPDAASPEAAYHGECNRFLAELDQHIRREADRAESVLRQRSDWTLVMMEEALAHEAELERFLVCKAEFQKWMQGREPVKASKVVRQERELRRELADWDLSEVHERVLEYNLRDAEARAHFWCLYIVIGFFSHSEITEYDLDRLVTALRKRLSKQEEQTGERSFFSAKKIEGPRQAPEALIVAEKVFDRLQLNHFRGEWQEPDFDSAYFVPSSSLSPDMHSSSSLSSSGFSSIVSSLHPGSESREPGRTASDGNRHYSSAVASVGGNGGEKRSPHGSAAAGSGPARRARHQRRSSSGEPPNWDIAETGSVFQPRTRRQTRSPTPLSPGTAETPRVFSLRRTS
ncbi:hypothetical protein JCM10908_005666 [Rhodotorula pacifica]|uniref:uncharacterized protein n=1 Tax=Rhodotorula pacifica TaxID=1495444 RepID=UPI003173BA68